MGRDLEQEKENSRKEIKKKKEVTSDCSYCMQQWKADNLGYEPKGKLCSTSVVQAKSLNLKHRRTGNCQRVLETRDSGLARIITLLTD